MTTPPDAAPTPTPAGAGPSIGRATAVMAAGTVLSRVTGFGRWFALAYAIGFGALADAYNLANTTPNILFELVVGGVMTATFVPVFVRRLVRAEDGRDEAGAWEAISAIVTLVAVVLAGLVVVFVVAAPWIVELYLATGRSTTVADDQRAVAVVLLRWFAPQVAIYGIVAVTTALLEARQRFAAPKFAPVLNNVVVIGVLLAFPHVAGGLAVGDVRGDTGALAFLGLGTTLGVAAMAAAQVPFLRGAGIGLRWRWAPRSEAVRELVGLSGWALGWVVANQLALFVVIALASRRPGELSAYQAALTFFQLPHAIVVVSLMAALGRRLSERYARNDAAGFSDDVGTGLRATLVVVVPAAAGLAVLAGPIVDVVLRYGALTQQQADVTADVLALLALGLPGFSAFLFLGRCFQARHDTRSLFWWYVVENGVNVVLAVVLHPSLGVRGLAAAYAAAYTVAAVGAAVHLTRAGAAPPAASTVPAVARTLVAAAAMAGVLLLARGALPDDGPTRALGVGALVALGVSVFAASARLLGVREISMLDPRGRRRR